MKSVNKVTLLGNVGNVEKVEGRDIVSFSVATSEPAYTKKDGTKVEEQTYWHRCVAFGKLSEIISQYVHKGDKLYVEGKLTYNDYEKDGQKRQSTDIVVNDITLLSSKNSGGYQPQQSAPINQPQPVGFNKADESDLPF